MSRVEILIVEDNHKERSLILRYLEDIGAYPSFASDVSEALEKVRSGNFCLVILSYETLGLQTHIFLDALSAMDSAPRTVITSNTPSVETAVALIKAGAMDFLAKPVQRDSIKAVLDLVLEQKIDKLDGSEQQRPSKKIEIITRDKGMEKLIALVDQIADSTASVLINGESGTGKEVFARYIHDKSSRRKKAFVAVNCAALPESLLESELFGYEKGAFTGAAARKPGKFEIASGGTILLDEITEMQPHLQSKLLRVIQEREIDRIGGIAPVPVDVRIIATTNRDIRASVDSGSFRDDLFYRLSTIPLNIPSLRKRAGDIPFLAEFFIQKYSLIDGRRVKGLTEAALSRICAYEFPGNVRELENMMHRAVLLAKADLIKPADLMMEDDEDDELKEIVKNGDQQPVSFSIPEDFYSAPLRDVERQMIFHTLEKTQGNRTHAAKLLGISVRTLRNKLNEYREEFGDIPDI